MSWQGGLVNWDLAKNVARQTVAAKGDPSVLDSSETRSTEAVRVADLWLEEVTSFPSGIRRCRHGAGRSGWKPRMPVWSRLCDPIAEQAVDAMGGMLTDGPGRARRRPPELQPRCPRCRAMGVAWAASAR